MAINLENQRFGRLVVLNEAKQRNGKRYWLCACDCGNKKEVYQHSLRKGKTRSCGCYAKEAAKIANTKHGMSNTKEFKVWASIKRRCYDKKDKRYKQYGGRGIAMCDKWLNDFSEFYKDMGPIPFSGAQIDRINNDGNYEPTNCRWVSAKQNMNNTTRSKYVEYKGNQYTVATIADELNIPRQTVYARIRRGKDWLTGKPLYASEGKEVRSG